MSLTEEKADPEENEKTGIQDELASWLLELLLQIAGSKWHFSPELFCASPTCVFQEREEDLRIVWHTDLGASCTGA